jgi:hypothetical protein
MKLGHRDPDARRHVRAQRYADAELPNLPDIRTAALLLGRYAQGARWVAVQREADCRSVRLYFYDERPAAGEAPAGCEWWEIGG